MHSNNNISNKFLFRASIKFCFRINFLSQSDEEELLLLELFFVRRFFFALGLELSLELLDDDDDVLEELPLSESELELSLEEESEDDDEDPLDSTAFFLLISPVPEVVATVSSDFFIASTFLFKTFDRLLRCTYLRFPLHS